MNDLLRHLVAAIAVALATLQPTASEARPRALRYTATQGSWLSPTLSPDGRTIVFELLGDLYGMPVTGGRAKRLTSGSAFDSQPSFSPDGRFVAFVSDRSGAENLWVAHTDGTAARQVTRRVDDSVLTSPTWSADGQSVFVSHVRTDLNAFELWRVDVATGKIDTQIPVEAAGTSVSVLSPSASSDGRWLYYAARVDFAATPELPEWTIRRRNLIDGRDEVVIAPAHSYRPDLTLGTMFRPTIARDGRRLIYATRNGAVTWLRLRDLVTGDDRWLAPLFDRDELGAVSPWRDLIPAAHFTPDGQAVIVGDGGTMRRIELRDGSSRRLAFTADVDLPLAAPTRVKLREGSGPVHARIIQSPEASPDGRRIAFSALGHVHVAEVEAKAAPTRITAADLPTFQPSWSPDGRSLTFVSWRAAEGGHVWIASDSRSPPRRISDVAAYYTVPAFTPDGRAVVALRSGRDERNHRYMEFGPLHEAELVVFPLDGTAPRVIASGRMGGKPHFTSGDREVHVLFDTGLRAVPLGGGPDRLVVQVTGAGFYFARDRAPADDLRLSPDGRSLLVQHAQQLHLVDMTGLSGKTIDLKDLGSRSRRVTQVGADYLDWSRDGRTITWSVGSTFLRAPVDAPDERSAIRSVIDVVRPRAMPTGSVLLRGATVVTMAGDAVVADADVLVTGDRIAAIGTRGRIVLPTGVRTIDVSGRWIVPGLIDAHVHYADIRRGVLDLEMWSASASLAYGITTVFDPSPLSIDMLVYEDMIDAGLITGSRVRSTGPALFSFNEFASQTQVDNILSRYRDHYRVGNIKMYRSGNRRVRRWIADSARRMGLQPTGEGAGSTKLGLTMLIDGYAGHEHVMPTLPLGDDIVRLFAATGSSYTGTLLIQNTPDAQDWFIVRDRLNADHKFNRFTPRFVVDTKTRSRRWFEDDAYRFPAYAKGIAAVSRAGGLIAIGSHGEMPGIGTHWEMRAHAAGGMTPLEILRAATLGSATAIGRGSDLGSIEVGKLADLLVLTRDPRQRVEHLADIAQVMKGGRLYDGATLDELYPAQRRFPTPWYRNDQPSGTSANTSVSAVEHRH